MPEQTDAENPQGTVVTTGHTPDAATVGVGVDTSAEAQTIADQIATEYPARPTTRPVLTRRKLLGGALATALSATAVGAYLLRQPEKSRTTPTPASAAGGVSRGETPPHTPVTTNTRAVGTPTQTQQVISSNPTRQAIDTPPPPTEITVRQVIPTITPQPPETPVKVEIELPTSFKLTSEVVTSKYGHQELVLNPDDPEAKERAEELMLFTHEQAFLANNPDAAAKFDKTKPDWFKTAVKEGLITYTIPGHKSSDYDPNKKPTSVIVNPSKGLNLEVVEDENQMNTASSIKYGVVMFQLDRQAAYIVDEEGKLTIRTLISKKVTANSYNQEQLGTVGAAFWDTMMLQSISAVSKPNVLQGSGTISYNEAKPWERILFKPASNQFKENTPYGYNDKYLGPIIPLLTYPKTEK